MTHFIKAMSDGSYGGEVFTSGKETELEAFEPGSYYIPSVGRTDGPWEGKVYNREADLWSAPVKPVLPTATIVVYGDGINSPQAQFDVGDTVNVRATFSPSFSRVIPVPVDRLDAEGNVVEPATLWFKLNVVNGVGTVSKVFNRAGRYGIGSRTSQEFQIPETEIIVFA